MSAARETGDLLALAAQGTEHLERLRALLDREGPPDEEAVARVLEGNVSERRAQLSAQKN